MKGVVLFTHFYYAEFAFLLYGLFSSENHGLLAQSMIYGRWQGDGRLDRISGKNFEKRSARITFT